MLRLGVPFIALWMCGCVADDGESTSDAGYPGEGPMSGPVAGGGAPEAHLRQVAELLCQAQSRCCARSAEVTIACVDQLADVTASAAYARPFELGLARFDEGQAATCLRSIEAALGAADCESNVLEAVLGSETALRRCDAVAEGLVPGGGVCEFSVEIEGGGTYTLSSDTFCRGGLTCVRGICGPPAARGERCEFSDDCRDDLRCHEETELCAARTKNGGDCTEGDECEAGLVCHDDEGRCAPPRAEGEPCGWDPDCASRHCTDEGRCAVASAQDFCD